MNPGAKAEAISCVGENWNLFQRAAKIAMLNPAVVNHFKKNKLFNFFAYEQWLTTQPSSNVSTVPTEAERNGDFSRALTPQGAPAHHLRPLHHSL